MPEKKFSAVGHSFPRKDAVARVTGRERYTCRWQLQGVACRNASFVRIPGSTEARHD
jgi:CO/xanthine dehydrogenase Mo-binding subunit